MISSTSYGELKNTPPSSPEIVQIIGKIGIKTDANAMPHKPHTEALRNSPKYNFRHKVLGESHNSVVSHAGVGSGVVFYYCWAIERGSQISHRCNWCSSTLCLHAHQLQECLDSFTGKAFGGQIGWIGLCRALLQL